ncbi:hypothetical protein BS50DRAFT_569605 [Corynespora cassiicola Philippines]|uniref:EthD domain-containing protein n=1 Tax=Corynespora cassiicola Philippines TaxID=1448308 RepID=A0A2T2P2X7_CORCC|nr:hypothetical protein BS50DRAFT_569605 [Corynespora cassiicola Philippines]
MPYTVVYFITRKPTLSSDQFKDYWESKHIPLLQSLTGPLFPAEYTRRYLARIDRKGFGGPSNRDRPLLVLRGSPEDIDWVDGIAELSFDTEKAFQEFYRCIYETEAAAKLAADEEMFMDTSQIKAVVVGETTTTKK